MSFHILEENVKMEGKMNLQDTFLNEARKENAPVSIFLMNGVQLKGKVKSFDSFTVLLVSENRSDRKSTRLNSSHNVISRMPSSA